MFNPSTNFIGKDPMQWWIGQVTDPDKGKWGDSLEKAKAENPDEEIYTFRCRVRIVGYHGNDVDLPDDELPMAHVLLPPNTTTVGGSGQTMQYQGGEVVVGFFFDGEDAQQPVIFGTLFKQPFAGDELSNKDFDSKKQTDFIPYTPPKVVQRSGKTRYNPQWQPQSPNKRTFTDGESVKTPAQEQKEASTNIVIDQFTPCEDNEISKISNAIKDFTRKMEQLQAIGGGSAIDPIYGGVVDIKDEIKLTSARIHNSTTKLVRRARSWLIQDTLDKLNLSLKDKTPKTLQAPVGQATKSLTDVIFCNIEKIQEGLAGYLSKSLENMIGQVLDVPICGVENFLSDMFGQINNIIDNDLGGMFSQLNNIQGGGIGLPSETFSKAIKFANIITNVLDCDRLNCPEPSSFSSKNGVGLNGPDDFGGLLDKIGFKKLESNLLNTLDNAIPAIPSAPDCSTNVLKCGPPRVDFIGSSGQGATGSAIVNAIGNIIGVSINGPGFGFEEPPLLSFFDSCDKGFGAGGYAVLGPVSPLTDGTNVAAGAVGGLPLTSNGLPINAGAVGGIQVSTPDGQQVLTEDGDPVIVGGIGGIPVSAGGVGGSPLTVGDKPIVVNGEGGQGLVAGAFPVVVGAPVPVTGSGGVGGGTGAGAGDINTSLVTSVSEQPTDTEDGKKTGAITGISPYTSTEFIIVEEVVEEELEDGTFIEKVVKVKDFSQGPYCKYKILGAKSGTDGKGSLFDIFTGNTGLIEEIIINSGGIGYSVGEIITIPGDGLCGSTPEDDVTFEVTSVSSSIQVSSPSPPLPPPIPAGIGGVNAGVAAGVPSIGGVNAGVAGAVGGIDANTPSFSGFNITVGGVPNTDGLYVSDPNGTELGVVNVVITDPGQGYLPNTTETTLEVMTDDDGNQMVDANGNPLSTLTTKEIFPDPNANYDGEQSFLTSLGDVVVTNVGFGYKDGDTVTVSGGGTGDGTGDGTGTGGAEVELEIQNGNIIGAKVINGGSGFTGLPDLTINSDSGVGGRLLPVLNFTKVQDASKLVESVRQSAVTVISCITK